MLKRRFFVFLLLISILKWMLYASADTFFQCRNLHTNSEIYSHQASSQLKSQQLFRSCLTRDSSEGDCKPLSQCTYEKMHIIRLNICCFNGSEIYICCPKVTETSVSESAKKAETESFSRSKNEKNTDYPVLIRQTKNQSLKPNQTDFSDDRSGEQNFGNIRFVQTDAGKHSPKQTGIIRDSPEEFSGVNHTSEKANIDTYETILTNNENYRQDQNNSGKQKPEQMDFGKPAFEQIHIEEHVLVRIDNGKQRQEQTAVVRHISKQVSGGNHRSGQTNSEKDEPVLADSEKRRSDRTDFGKPIIEEIHIEEHRVRQTNEEKYRQDERVTGIGEFQKVPYGMSAEEIDTDKHSVEAIYSEKDGSVQIHGVHFRPENADAGERLAEETYIEKDRFQKNSTEVLNINTENFGTEEIESEKYRLESSFGIPLVENLDFLLSQFEVAEPTEVKSSSKTEPEVKVLHDEYLNPPIVETFETEDIVHRSVECGRKRFADGQSIFKGFVLGGTNAKATDWPWVVSVQVRNRWGLNRFLCGGSLITPRHVLTAAHCFDSVNRKSSHVFVILGSNRRNPQPSENATTMDVIKITIHEDYDKSRHYNDIAVLSLAWKVQSEKIVPVCLPEESRSVNSYQQVTVLGWGQLKLGGVTSETLQQATLQVVPQRYCRKAFVNVSRESLPIGIISSMICGGSPKGGVDACEGDSGGPLQMESEDRWIQIGIVSFGYKCGLENYPGVYTRVSSFVPWIKQTISVGKQ